MRNLRNSYYNQWKSPDGRYLTATEWDITNDSLICTLGSSESIAKIELIRIDFTSRSPTHKSIISWDVPSPYPDLVCDEIINLHYFPDTLTTCMVMSEGDITIVNQDPLIEDEQIEIVGSVDEGITAAEWSPDDELLAITTKVNTFIFLSRNFEEVMNIAMKNEDLHISKQISVGWGKKETQFRGRGARAMKDPTMPERIDEGVLSPYDDLKTSISWRGDGAFVAISSVEDKKRRVIRIYSREGVIESVSEPVDGLEGTLSWRPAGNIIAGIQRLETCVNVVFFERNGLRHGQFSLRLTSEQFSNPSQNIELQWSPDSTVLAVTMAEYTEFWTMSNYHWYLKQQVSHDHPISKFCLKWHPEKSLRCIFTSKERVTMVDHIFTTTHTAITSFHDFGIVAVVDGKTIKLTPFMTVNTPPPLSLHEIEVTSNVIDVSVNDDTCSIAVLHQTGISIFFWNNVMVTSSCPYLVREITFPRANFANLKYQQISWSSNHQVVILQNSDSVSSIIRYGSGEQINGKEIIEPKMINTTQNISIISTLSSFSKGANAHAFTQNNRGEIQILSQEENDGVISPRKLNFPLYLPWVELIPFGDDIITIGMSNNGHLYANNRLLAKNCTSFLTSPVHLIYTTSSHLLKFVHITDVQNLDIPDDNDVDERCRSIERGSRLVTAMPTALCLILQMPRGNLETIYPRAMVLAGIRRLIQEKNFKVAFSHCRTHRVDMNILYDYAPEHFLSNIKHFLIDVTKPEYIDLFLSSLREEDVTKTIFKEVGNAKIHHSIITKENSRIEVDQLLHEKFQFETNASVVSKSSKVNKICDAFLTEFRCGTIQTPRAEHIQNIITAHVCKSPPALEDALVIIAQLMKTSPNVADKAAEHICFLADVDKLYNDALGLYNLELALLIVQQSQKDPREYLPFLQNLQEMSDVVRQFNIDNYLGRHSKALENLYSRNAFDELKDYTQKHLLFSEALSLYRYNPANYAILMSLYADYLESKSDHSSAALAYESLSDYPKATSCYLSSGPSFWRQTLFCALSQSPPVSGSALKDIASTIYDALIESKDFYSAATVQLDYLCSVSVACQTFCRGYFFAEALHLCAVKQQPELLTTVIEPGLQEAFASSTELLADCKSQVLAQVARIRELRLRALTNPLGFYEGERIGADANIPDDMSIAASSHLTTNRSLFTRYTGKGGGLSTMGTVVSRATSKHRKKEERKRAMGKKGSIYEEEYLINSMERLIKRVERSREDIGRLVEGLIRRGMWDQARTIEDNLGNMVKMCESVIPELFNAETCSPEENQEQQRQVSGDIAPQKSPQIISKRTDLPVITPFNKLSLLR